MSSALSHREKFADGVIHVIGMAAGSIGALSLLVWASVTQPLSSTATLAIYCAGLVAMLGCSGAYHMIPTAAWKPILRRLDHAAIFVKIAGTYTPFALLKLDGATGMLLFGFVWTVALSGAAAKLLLETRWDGLAIALYLALGWSGIATLQPLVASMAPAALMLLAAGGIIYSLGVIFFLWRSLPYHNAIWHLFVLVATACHFGAVTIAVGS